MQYYINPPMSQYLCSCCLCTASSPGWKQGILPKYVIYLDTDTITLSPTNSSNNGFDLYGMIEPLEVSNVIIME